MYMKNNFKTIKDLSTQLLFENVATNSTNSFSYNKFLTEIKKSPILKTQFIVYTNIENEHFTDRASAERFLQENIDLFSRFNKKEILNENQKLINELFKNNKINESEDTLFELIIESTKDKKISGIYNRTKLFTQIVDKLMENKSVINEEENKIDSNLPFKKVVRKATEILNDKFSFLSESELSILKAFINNDETEKEKLFTNLINENLKLVKRKLFEDDKYNSEELETLNLTEEKLKKSTYNNTIQIGEYSKLINLINTLKG